MDRWACVDVFAPPDVTAARETIKTILWRHSPRIEPADEPGVFWLDASGLGTLYPRLSRWVSEVGSALLNAGFSAHVVVGFSRFGTYAAARAATGHRVFATAAEEQAALGRIQLACLRIEPELSDMLDKLGVRSVADFLRLPAAGLLARFGKTAYRLHRMAAGDLLVPKLLLRGEAVAALRVTFTLDRHLGVLGPEEVRPAVPTLETALLLELLRLRVESLSLGAGVVAVELEASGVPATVEQLRVFAEESRRDLHAGARALARLRAELGEQAVVVAVLQPAHLPEASFVWRPVSEVRQAWFGMSEHSAKLVRLPPSPNDTSMAASLARRPLVRRLHARPLLLKSRPRHARDDGWIVFGPSPGAVIHEAGPYLLSGGWWVREVQRDYRYVLTRRGDLLWIFYDHHRHRLCLHAQVQ